MYVKVFIVLDSNETLCKKYDKQTRSIKLSIKRYELAHLYKDFLYECKFKNHNSVVYANYNKQCRFILK